MSYWPKEIEEKIARAGKDKIAEGKIVYVTGTSRGVAKPVRVWIEGKEFVDDEETKIGRFSYVIYNHDKIVSLLKRKGDPIPEHFHDDGKYQYLYQTALNAEKTQTPVKIFTKGSYVSDIINE